MIISLFQSSSKVIVLTFRDSMNSAALALSSLLDSFPFHCKKQNYFDTQHWPTGNHSCLINTPSYTPLALRIKSGVIDTLLCTGILPGWGPVQDRGWIHHQNWDTFVSVSPPQSSHCPIIITMYMCMLCMNRVCPPLWTPITITTDRTLT